MLNLRVVGIFREIAKLKLKYDRAQKAVTICRTSFVHYWMINRVTKVACVCVCVRVHAAIVDSINRIVSRKTTCPTGKFCLQKTLLHL